MGRQMRRAAQRGILSYKEQIRSSSRRFRFQRKSKGFESFRGIDQPNPGLRLSIALILASLIIHTTNSPFSPDHFISYALAESEEAGAEGETGKRPVRYAPDGTEIVDYISELEQSNDALEQQIRSLKEQLARQNSGSVGGAGDTPVNSIKERDLPVGKHNQRQEEISESAKRGSSNSQPVEARVVEFKQENKFNENGIKSLRDPHFAQSNAEVESAIQREEDHHPVEVRQEVRRESDRNSKRIIDRSEGRLREVEIDPQSDPQLYIAPVLPVVAGEETNNLLENQPVLPQISAGPMDVNSVEEEAEEQQADKAIPNTYLREQQIRARLSEDKNTDKYSNEGDHVKAEQVQEPIKKLEEAQYFVEQHQGDLVVAADEEHDLVNYENEFLARSIEGLPQRAISNNPAIIEAKRRVRTDVSTLISLVATREQLFRRYGSQGGQIQVSPSKLKTQRGQTVESVRARQEEARTIRDWKLIEADVAELRTIAEKDISFIRRYSRKSPG